MKLSFRKSNFLTAFFSLMLVYILLEGGLRFILLSSSAGILVYFLKLIMLLTVILSFSFSIKIKYIVFTFLVSIFFANGILINGINSAVVAAFVFLPLLFFYLNPINNYIDSINKVFIFTLLFILVIGLSIDISQDFVWSGYTTTVNGIEVNGSKKWWSEGRQRLAGFGRSSIDTAMLASFLCLLFLIKTKSFKAATLVFSIAFYAVYLTTTKGALLALTISFFFYLLPQKYKFLRTSIFVFFVLLGNFVLLLSLLDVNVSFLKVNYLSLYERIEFMWPATIQKVTNEGLLLGLGLGGVGVASSINGDLWAAVDNFWLYIIATFGLPIWLILFSLTLLKSTFFSMSKHSSFYLFFIIYGVTNNMLENMLAQFILVGIIQKIVNVGFNKKETEVDTN